MAGKPRILNIKFEQIIYTPYIIPHGKLPWDKAAHALFTYATRARLTWEEQEVNLIQYEGQLETQHNYFNLFKGIAFWYQVKPDEMVRYWNVVDEQFDLLDIPRVPDLERIRFNKVPEIKSN